MKKIILLLALFPFLHATSYPVEYESCQPQEIKLRYKAEIIQVSLFNIGMKKEAGWDKTCSLLKNAKTIRIEIDPSSKIEKPIIPVYLFADKTLIQEELIRSNVAYPMIHNPEYTYEKRLEKAIQTTAVIAKPVSKTKAKEQAVVAPLYVLALICIWLLMLIYMVAQRKHKRNLKSKKTTVK